jgi:predicted Ser/Thr protein kinase
MSNPDSDSPGNDEGTRVRQAPAPDRTQVRTPAAAPETIPEQGATLYRQPATVATEEIAATLVAPQRTSNPSAAANATLVKPHEPTLVVNGGAANKPISFDVGAVIRDRFVLESLLGRGGMGIVFAALDRRKEEARDPNPHIAIKILNADFQQHPDALIALQREARKAQTLAHPNVVTVFDFDRDGASVYMTMERLRGRSLDAMVREARGRGIGREAALPIIRGIAEGLAYAHRKGIVHSDLKPGNVFVL